MGCKQLQLNNYFTLRSSKSVVGFRVQKTEQNGELVEPTYSYSYDQYGRLSKITDPKARATTFAYDALGRQLTRTLPMGQSESQSYNTLGQLATKTDFKGVLTEFTYDNFGRTEYKTYSFGNSSETIQFTYDNLGRQHEIIEARGTTTYSYNSFNSLTKISSPEGDVNYEYDTVTSRKTRAYSANTDTSYSYDTLGRLATVTDTNGATTYNYTKVGSRSDVTLPNGAKTVYQYDNLNRLTNLTNKNSSNDILSSYTYSLAPNGRRTAVVELTSKTDAPAPSSSDFSTRNIAYTYDGLNRLTKEVSECADNAELQFTDEYTYDLVGNRISKQCSLGFQPENISYTYNNNDQLLTEISDVNGTTVYTYDANGSQIGKSSTNAVYTFGYNLQNRLASATINRMEGVSSVDIQSNYVYNQSGIRVRSNSTQIVDGVTTNKNRIFLLDSGMTGYSQILEELDAVGGTLVKSYTLGDDVISQSSALGVRHFAYDGHGSTRLLTDSSSAITDKFDYDAYGIQLGQTPNVTNIASTDLLYSGEQYDSDLQMQYLRARYYDQSNGRFNRADDYMGSNSDPQSLHKYAYCHSDPIGGIDPSGMMTLVEMSVAVATVMILHTITAVALQEIQFQSDVKWVPDAGIIGVVGTSSKVLQWLGKFIGMLSGKLNSGGLHASLSTASTILKSGVLGMTVGAEILFSVASGQLALYLYGGGHLGRSSSSGSASVYTGLVWNLTNSKAYNGNFYSAGGSMGSFGGNAFWGDDGPNGRTYGVTFGRSARANTSIGGSWTKYYRILNINMSNSGYSPYLAGSWSLISSTLVGRIKNPGMLFALTALPSIWGYAKWKSSGALAARQLWGE